MYPAQLRYSKEHGWAKVEGRHVRIGITEVVADRFPDVVYVGLPNPGANITPAQTCGVVESVDAVCDLYAPLAGTVVEINRTLVERPEVIHADPYGEAWLMIVEPCDPAELARLLDADAYAAHVRGQLAK